MTIAYFAAKGVKSAASGHKHTVDRIIDSVVLVLIVFLIVRTFLTRKTSNRDQRADLMGAGSPPQSPLRANALLPHVLDRLRAQKRRKKQG